jgi:hypothetical protein
MFLNACADASAAAVRCVPPVAHFLPDSQRHVSRNLRVSQGMLSLLTSRGRRFLLLLLCRTGLGRLLAAFAAAASLRVVAEDAVPVFPVLGRRSGSNNWSTHVGHLLLQKSDE